MSVIIKLLFFSHKFFGLIFTVLLEIDLMLESFFFFFFSKCVSFVNPYLLLVLLSGACTKPVLPCRGAQGLGVYAAGLMISFALSCPTPCSTPQT